MLMRNAKQDSYSNYARLYQNKKLAETLRKTVELSLILDFRNRDKRNRRYSFFSKERFWFNTVMGHSLQPSCYYEQ